MSYAIPRIRASVAPLVRPSLDFDGSGFAQAVAFEDDAPLTLAERFSLFGVILLASIPYIYVGAWAAEVLG